MSAIGATTSRVDLGVHLPPDQPVDPETGIVVLPTMDWDELAWLRSVCPIPLIAKGILRADDAIARRRGRLRRHLGQQPRRAGSSTPRSPAADALPEIVDAVRRSRAASWSTAACAAASTC